MKSLYLQIERKHYGKFGVVPLKKGDDWLIDARIVNSQGEDTDIQAATASTAFPAASGGAYMAETSVTLSAAGKVQIKVPDSDSKNIRAGDEIALYLVLDDAGDIQTVPMASESVQIRERDFQVY